MSETKTAKEIISELEALFSRWGTNKYDEQVSQIEHAVQCADYARIDNADDELIVATLLHDIGHLLELERRAGNVILTKNDDHESTGAAYLARHFSSAVTAPIALHVRPSDFCARPKIHISPNFRLLRCAVSKCRAAKCRPMRSNASPNTPRASVPSLFAAGMNSAKISSQVV